MTRTCCLSSADGLAPSSTLAILLESVLKTLLPSLAIRPIRTTHSILGHALFVATRYLANIASHYVATGVSNGTAAVSDAGITLFTVSFAVRAA